MNEQSKVLTRNLLDQDPSLVFRNASPRRNFRAGKQNNWSSSGEKQPDKHKRDSNKKLLGLTKIVFKDLSINNPKEINASAPKLLLGFAQNVGVEGY